MAIVFDGQKEAKRVQKDLKGQLSGRKLNLLAVTVGSDPINEDYLKQLERTAAELGVDFAVQKFDQEASFLEVASFLEKENQSEEKRGILIQVSPGAKLFSQREEVAGLIGAQKDVDCLGQSRACLTSVSQAVLAAIRKAGEALAVAPKKMKVLIVGNQGFWGRRLERDLRSQDFENVSGIDREVTDLPLLTLEADIIVSCVGQANLIKEKMVKNGVILVDVGFSLVDGKLVGDIDFESVKKKAAFVTPVPGGIGPLSTILVFKNLVEKNS